MNEFAQFCGFFATHGVWQLAGGESVVPFLASIQAGQRQLERFSADDYEKAVESARQRLAEIRPSSEYSVLVFDGYFTDETVRSEALFMEAYDSAEAAEPAFVLAIPYRRFPDALILDQLQIL